MTREDILAAATLIWDKQNWTEIQGDRLVRLANLVAFRERERCAKLVESLAKQYSEPIWAVELVNDIRASQ
jgi:hypothetical protein